METATTAVETRTTAVETRTTDPEGGPTSEAAHAGASSTAVSTTTPEAAESSAEATIVTGEAAPATQPAPVPAVSTQDPAARSRAWDPTPTTREPSTSTTQSPGSTHTCWAWNHPLAHRCNRPHRASTPNHTGPCGPTGPYRTGLPGGWAGQQAVPPTRPCPTRRPSVGRLMLPSGEGPPGLYLRTRALVRHLIGYSSRNWTVITQRRLLGKTSRAVAEERQILWN